MNKTVICRIDLGKTRVAGYLIYYPETKEFLECTSLEVKRLIRNNELNGLMLEGDEIVLDKDFNQNLMIRSGVGRYRAMYEDDMPARIRMYAVTQMMVYGDYVELEVISNTCARLVMSSEHVAHLCKLGAVAGCKVDDKNNLLIHDSIPITEFDTGEECNEENAGDYNTDTDGDPCTDGVDQDINSDTHSEMDLCTNIDKPSEPEGIDIFDEYMEAEEEPKEEPKDYSNLFDAVEGMPETNGMESVEAEDNASEDAENDLEENVSKPKFSLFGKKNK